MAQRYIGISRYTNDVNTNDIALIGQALPAVEQPEDHSDRGGEMRTYDQYA